MLLELEFQTAELIIIAAKKKDRLEAPIKKIGSEGRKSSASSLSNCHVNVHKDINTHMAMRTDKVICKGRLRPIIEPLKTKVS